jgi:hypothetical protein
MITTIGLAIAAAGAIAVLMYALRHVWTRLERRRFAAELASMTHWIARRDWAGLETHFYQVTTQACGRARAHDGASVDIAAYGRELGEALQRALTAALESGASVIAYLHRPHDDWTGTFCVYRSSDIGAVGPPRRLDACVAEIAGPTSAELGALYRRQGDALNPFAAYLVARTIALLGRCTEEIALGSVALCAAFEDDGSLLWLHHGTARAGGRAHDAGSGNGTGVRQIAR